jgi:hypothetical protein
MTVRSSFVCCMSITLIELDGTKTGDGESGNDESQRDNPAKRFYCILRKQSQFERLRG